MEEQNYRERPEMVPVSQEELEELRRTHMEAVAPELARIDELIKYSHLHARDIIIG